MDNPSKLKKMKRVTRFSDLDWASEIRNIFIVGAGGIGSYTIFNLSRIGHILYICDFDTVDETNTIGGQLYRTKDINKLKVVAISEICEEFGCINSIDPIQHKYDEELGMTDICITGLDNMKARKEVYYAWKNHLYESVHPEDCLFIDGRLIAELSEVFTIKGDDGEGMKDYEENWLFEDSEVEDLSCTAKQTSFMAMNIASLITATLCNFLTNRKLSVDFREVPFHQRFYSPLLDYKIKEEIYES